MGKKVKLKIKHLLFIPLFLFIIFPNVLYFSAKVLFDGNEYIGDTPYRAYAYGLLKLYDSWPKVNSFKNSASYMMGKCVYSNIPIKYSIGYNSGYDDGKYPKLAITGNKICEEYISLSYDDYKESVEHFENVTKSGKSNAILGKSIINLTNLYLDGNEKEMACNLYANYINSNNDDVKLAARISEISYLSRIGNKEEALSKAEKLYKENNSIDIETLYLDMLLLNGELDEGYKITSDRGQVAFNQEVFTFDNKMIKEYYDELDSINSRELFEDSFYMDNKLMSGKSIIKGRVTAGEKSIPYQKVKLYHFKKESFSYGNYLVTYTDENGNYSFNNLKEDSYVVKVELPDYLRDEWILNYATYDLNNEFIDINNDESIIKNIELVKKVKLLNEENDIMTGENYLLKWTPVEGAMSYDVNIYIPSGRLNENEGVQCYMATYSDITNTEYKLPLVDGSLMSSIYLYDSYYDKIFHSFRDEPVNILGPIDGRDIYVQIVPKDKLKNAMQGYRCGRLNINNVFTLKSTKKSLNNGDELIIEGKVSEGIEWFKERIAEEGYKKEYIYPILKYYILKSNSTEKDKIDYLYYLEELYKLNYDKSEMKMYKWMYEYFQHGLGYHINPLF